MGKIDDIIRDKKVTPADCDYHTRRSLENGGSVRVLRIKGDNINHIEYKCPKCGHAEYTTMEHTQVSKAAKIRFVVPCSKCGEKIKVDKLKGKK